MRQLCDFTLHGYGHTCADTFAVSNVRAHNATIVDFCKHCGRYCELLRPGLRVQSGHGANTIAGLGFSGARCRPVALSHGPLYECAWTWDVCQETAGRNWKAGARARGTKRCGGQEAVLRTRRRGAWQRLCVCAGQRSSGDGGLVSHLQGQWVPGARCGFARTAVGEEVRRVLMQC